MATAVTYSDLLDTGLMRDVEELRAHDPYREYMRADDDPQAQARRYNAERKRKWKAAHREQVKADKRAYYQRHREEILARKRARYQRMKTEQPEKYAETLALQRLYRDGHKDEQAASNRAHYLAHREETIERVAEYQKKHPGKRAQYQRNYRAKKKAKALEQERKELRPHA